MRPVAHPPLTHARSECAAAANLDQNYGVTSKIDEQLKLSQSVSKVTDKANELKDSLTSKVDDLKAKAASSEPSSGAKSGVSVDEKPLPPCASPPPPPGGFQPDMSLSKLCGDASRVASGSAIEMAAARRLVVRIIARGAAVKPEAADSVARNNNL